MKYDGILLCSDYDGTLIGGPKISDENREAILMFQANGGKFTMATGRTPLYISQVMRDVMPNAPMIAVNGSVIYDADSNSELVRIPLNCDLNAVAELYSIPECIGCNLILNDYNSVELRKADGFCTSQLYNAAPEQLLKIVFIFDNTKTPEESSLTFNSRYGDRFYFCRSWAESLEMLDKNATKGGMLKRLKKLLPNITTTIGVGDYENDISLLSDADIGYAVENAIDCVKAVSDRITSSCNDNAIAKIIYEL